MERALFVPLEANVAAASPSAAIVIMLLERKNCSQLCVVATISYIAQ